MRYKINSNKLVSHVKRAENLSSGETRSHFFNHIQDGINMLLQNTCFAWL